MNYRFMSLLEIVKEVLTDALMEMGTLMTAHVVGFTGIGKEVGLGAGGDTCLEKGEAVLRHDGRVVVASDNLELALEVFCLVDSLLLLAMQRVCLRSIHIAFAIHHLIPMPVDNRTAGNTNLEYVRIVCH